jgi:hypothetical protein
MDELLQNKSEIVPEKLERLRALIAAAEWRATKTYPDHMAHSYTMCEANPELCSLLREVIKEHGFTKKFYKTTYNYIIVDGYKYWAFITLVNREEMQKSLDREGKPELGG